MSSRYSNVPHDCVTFGDIYKAVRADPTASDLLAQVQKRYDQLCRYFERNAGAPAARDRAWDKIDLFFAEDENLLVLKDWILERFDKPTFNPEEGMRSFTHAVREATVNGEYWQLQEPW